jgi:cold shock CspA family protein
MEIETVVERYIQDKGYGYIRNPSDNKKLLWFHISDVTGELTGLLYLDPTAFKEPIICETKKSDKKPGSEQAFNIRLNTNKRTVGYVKTVDQGFGFIEDAYSNVQYFYHHTNIIKEGKTHIPFEKDMPVVFSKSSNEKGLNAIHIRKVDNRSALENFAEFDDFNRCIDALRVIAETEPWDYIVHKKGNNPVLYSYINYTFDRIINQKKIIIGKSSKDGIEYAYFNTGLVTDEQEEIYCYFKKKPIIENEINDSVKWYIKKPEYIFLEFGTDQSNYRKFFQEPPEAATYFLEAEVKELVFDASLNKGKIILDRDHIKDRRVRFPERIQNFSDELFFDEINKAVELAIKRIKRNWKTAIPHFYDGNIQFLLPLCMISKKTADLALVVKKEESVYKAHTVLTLDQAYNNARLLAKPDREWLKHEESQIMDKTVNNTDKVQTLKYKDIS